jgi:2-keto-3-deoxy-6-phosphogluconate aldolase
VIHTTGTIPENDLQEFLDTECYAVLRGGEVTREKVQATIDWE